MSRPAMGGRRQPPVPLALCQLAHCLLLTSCAKPLRRVPVLDPDLMRWAQSTRLPCKASCKLLFCPQECDLQAVLIIGGGGEELCQTREVASGKAEPQQGFPRLAQPASAHDCSAAAKRGQDSARQSRANPQPKSGERGIDGRGWKNGNGPWPTDQGQRAEEEQVLHMAAPP